MTICYARSGVENALASLTKLRSWLDSSEADLVRRLTSEVSFPEAAIADKSRGTLGGAAKTPTVTAGNTTRWSRIWSRAAA